MNISDYFKNSVLENFVNGQGLTVDFLASAIISMVLAILIGMLIYAIYSHYYGGVVFSSSFATTLVGMTVLTSALTLAISSNVIISLGMVGALSIVRYRTAIKDPMDLFYIFWSISEGIILGAGLYGLAVVIMPLLTFVVHVFYHKRQKGVIFVLVVHYTEDRADDEIQRCLIKTKAQLKSKTIRAGIREVTYEVLCKTNSTVFLEKINSIDSVTDATLIQYNGEYHG